MHTDTARAFLHPFPDDSMSAEGIPPGALLHCLPDMPMLPMGCFLLLETGGVQTVRRLDGIDHDGRMVLTANSKNPDHKTIHFDRANQDGQSTRIKAVARSVSWQISRPVLTDH